MREAILYAGESAFLFQYTNFSKQKYKKDSAWLKLHKGFTASEAAELIDSIKKIINKKMPQIVKSFKSKPPDEWKILPAYCFTSDELSNESAIEKKVVDCFLSSFSTTEKIKNFNALDDFNPTNVAPIIKLDDETFCLFQLYSLCESLYESPFFWFQSDSQYFETAMKNRGDFTEDFTTARLTEVFGSRTNRVNTNVILKKGKDIVGEVDVLATYGDRLIVVQAKSKKLTIAARKGNDNALNSDFKNSVQKPMTKLSIALKSLRIKVSRHTLKTESESYWQESQKRYIQFALLLNTTQP
ncbi:hypothetical protein J057_03650 [Marinobacter nanhaiticus D15-8W]|uniref:NERD domain-containing protein n=2 Tax=Marinobacter TaxID=2742 RepID=N6X6P0_9GAMM|nr:hypothetical protein J057_03650 [Marinobacter nanhaiticus D15-8W]